MGNYVTLTYERPLIREVKLFVNWAVLFLSGGCPLFTPAWGALLLLEGGVASKDLHGDCTK